MHADRKCCDPQEPPKPRFTESSRNGRRRTIDEMQTVLDQYLGEYNTKRPHQGRGMNAARRLPPSSMVLERRIPQYQTRSAKPPNPCPPRRLLSADYPLYTQYGVLQILSATRAVDQLWMRRRRGRSSGRRTDGCARPGRAPARIGGGHNGGAAIIAAMVPIGATVIGAVIPAIGAAVSSVRRPRAAATRSRAGAKASPAP